MVELIELRILSLHSVHFIISNYFGIFLFGDGMRSVPQQLPQNIFCSEIHRQRPYTTRCNSHSTPALYIAKFPLEGLELIENLPAALADEAALHEALLIEHQQGCFLFDFLPLNAKNPLVLAALVSGGCVTGEARKKELKSLPRRRLQRMDSASFEHPIERATEFTETWNGTELQLFKRDCRDFTKALLLHMTA